MQIKQSFLLLLHKSSEVNLIVFFPTPIIIQNFTPSVSARNLGVTFDNSLHFRQHISQTSRCPFYHIRDLRRFRQFMSFAVTKTIETALVSSRLDYCNSLYHNIALNDILKLQSVQNHCIGSLSDIALFSTSVQLPVKHFHPSNQHIYIHCSLLQDSFDHLILINFLFSVLRQMLELELFQLLGRRCGIHSLLVLSM